MISHTWAMRTTHLAGTMKTGSPTPVPADDAVPARPATQDRRLASPLEELGERYDVVVVGSGYGGAIAAARLARAGRSVAVLERGRERHAGEFPSTLAQAAREVQVRAGARRVGKASKLYELIADREVSVVVGSGLGGTSLINAGVALRAPAEVFDDDRWPTELRTDGRQVLDEYYDAAERMLGTTTVPETVVLRKYSALGRAAEALGGVVQPVPVNVAFEAHENEAGVWMEKCSLCGDCVAGCNHGAKSTVLQNYLPDAVAHGAKLFVETDVRAVVPAEGGGWTVTFAAEADGRHRFGAPDLFVNADVVVLAAGTLGSTGILHRSRQAGLAVSSRLGERFSGNGDALAWAYGAKDAVGGVGRGRLPLTDDTTVGPSITGMIDLTGRPGPGRNVLIEDGIVPGPLASIMPAALALAAGADTPEGKGLAGFGRRLWRSARTLAASAAGRRDVRTDATLTYLVMSDDAGDGTLRPQGDTVVVDWAGAGELPVFDAADGLLRQATAGLGAVHVRNPLWTPILREPLVTVHPLGGCAMGDDGSTGVVDHAGRVFVGDGDEVHDGLLVVDGSIIPRPLAVNPLLTIAALAERASALLAADPRWPAAEPTPRLAVGDPVTAVPGLRFTERMSGPVGGIGGAAVDPADAEPQAGADRGRADGTALEMVVTIGIDDLPALLQDTARAGRLSGTVTCPVLSPRRLRVLDGAFRLLESDATRVETWTMTYSMLLVADDGRRFCFEGVKYLHDRAGLDAWSDTTTLHVTIADDATGAAVAAGVLRLGVGDFARQLTTMRVTGVASRSERLLWTARFDAKFLWGLRRIYAGSLDDVGRFPEQPAQPVPLTGGGARVLDVPCPEPRWCDGRGHWHEGNAIGPDAWLRLIRYEGGRRGPVLLAGGFSMSATSFLGDTVRQNLVEHLTGKGYDVWLFDYRASIDLPSAYTSFTVDDIACEDWPAAVAEVLRVTGAGSVQMVGHCVGSVSGMMALGAGLAGVRSAVFMQFGLHPAVSTFNQLKAQARVGERLKSLGFGEVAPLVGTSVRNTLLDMGLRALPLSTGERCGKAVCRWINAIYGCTHAHDQLDEATHDRLEDMFGVGNLASLNHLSAIARRGVAVDVHGDEVYTANPERFRLPILLVSGARNRIFRPEGMLRTQRWLSRHNDPELYTRHVLPGYAHLDALIGRNASEDVFPVVSTHLDRFNP
ncbi:MAG TPA: GMC family oxidoreductase N-terminal domain-containing protein [Acidimicrobiales bacterium]|nr:GMC family oxidoreductase N-terminal domain-containing protein [Acidimicrobiales bacterium]